MVQRLPTVRVGAVVEFKDKKGILLAICKRQEGTSLRLLTEGGKEFSYPADKLTVASSMACECEGAAASCSSDCASGYVPYKFITVQVTAANDPWFPVIDKLVPTSFSGSAMVQVP